MLGILSIYFLNKNKFKILQGDDQNYMKYNKLLKNFEVSLRNYYPLRNNETFYIDHGNDYCAFFKRMGNMFMVIYEQNNKIVGNACGVLRNIQNNKLNQKIWYICDLKIDKQYRGKHIPFKMLCSAIHLVRLSKKGYAITMNKTDESSKNNKVVRLSSKINYSGVNFKYAGNILIYSVDYSTIQTIKQLLEEIKGKMHFVSLKGIKDLVILKKIESDNKNEFEENMKLLHVNFNKNENNKSENDTSIKYDDPIDGYTYMFCFHELDPIIKKLDLIDIKTDITASLIQCGMSDLNPEDWDFIQSSEI